MKKIMELNLATKTLVIFIFVLALGLQSNNASALFITQLDVTYESGATFSGILTFDDGLNNLLDVNGALSGYPWGPDPDYFTWTWQQGNGWSNNPIGDTGILADWLMDGTGPDDFANFIEIDWRPGGNNLVLDSSAGSRIAGYVANAIYYTDPMVSYTSTPNAPVPEPTTMLLLGTGLLGLAGFRKKFKN